jgi:hypothetical protein
MIAHLNLQTILEIFVLRTHGPLFFGLIASFTSPSRKHPPNARVTSAEELGAMSKNNLKGITLGTRPIWGINFLVLNLSIYFLSYVTFFKTKELTNQQIKDSLRANNCTSVEFDEVKGILK